MLKAPTGERLARTRRQAQTKSFKAVPTLAAVARSLELGSFFHQDTRSRNP
jgi:hypothetical protein